ncbi:MAG: VWA domain-containing protein, partial [Candidatus Schekmanbacteria bacterium]
DRMPLRKYYKLLIIFCCISISILGWGKQVSGVCADKVFVLFVLDTSGSMNQNDDIKSSKGSRIATLRYRAKRLITRIDGINSLMPRKYGIITFNSIVDSTKKSPRNASQAKSEIDLLTASGGTALYDAVWEGAQYLKTDYLQNNPNAMAVLVVLSDGVDNSSANKNKGDVVTKINNLKSSYSMTKVFFYNVEGSVPGGINGMGDINTSYTKVTQLTTGVCELMYPAVSDCPLPGEITTWNPPIEADLGSLFGKQTPNGEIVYVESWSNDHPLSTLNSVTYYKFDGGYSAGPNSSDIVKNPLEKMANETSSTYVNNDTIKFSKVFTDIIKKLPPQKVKGKVFKESPVRSAGGCGNITKNASTATLNDYRKKRKLKGLDGSGYLNGTYVRVHNLRDGDTCDSNNFYYGVDNGSFEEVMAYYHIDKFRRFISKSLGNGTGININKITVADVHDNNSNQASHFDYDNDVIYFAKVDQNRDDAEDADVILHEYAHAISCDINAGWTVTLAAGAPESKALVEGFADFLAGNYFKKSGFGKWFGKIRSLGCPLREMNNSLNYNSNITDPYEGSKIWSGALWEIRKRIGKNVGKKSKSLMNKYILTTVRDLDAFQDKFFSDVAERMTQDAGVIIQGHRGKMQDVFIERNILPEPPSGRIAPPQFPTTPNILSVTSAEDDTMGYGLHLEWDEIDTANLIAFELWYSVDGTDLY